MNINVFIIPLPFHSFITHEAIFAYKSRNELSSLIESRCFLSFLRDNSVIH